tara:strand:+ start:706 stop:1227 length:522 start_codon:yes stop_codon:yes gene_type:complete
MENFEINRDYYRAFDLKKEPRFEAPNGVSSDDQYMLAGRSYRCLGTGRQVGLFTNSNATEADRLSRKYVSYEGDSVEGSAKKAFFDGDIVRWKSNGRVPFGDMLLDFYHLGFITKEQMIVSAVEQERGNEEFWDNVTTERFKCEDTGEWMVRFVPSDKSFDEEVEYTNQRSVA